MTKHSLRVDAYQPFRQAAPVFGKRLPTVRVARHLGAGFWLLVLLAACGAFLLVYAAGRGLTLG